MDGGFKGLSSMTTKTDRELVGEFTNGSHEAFEELVSRYTQKAFGLALRITRTREDAEEVLQDVFINVYKKIDGFEGKSTFSSWLYRIVVNASFMKLRKKRQNHRMNAIDDLCPAERDSVRNAADASVLGMEELAANKEILEALSDAIARLPDEYRPVFVLRDVDGLSTKQVGKMLNLTAPAVKSRLHRSRMILRKRLLGIYREYFAHTAERRPMP